jgi:hypothetical protein
MIERVKRGKAPDFRTPMGIAIMICGMEFIHSAVLFIEIRNKDIC